MVVSKAELWPIVILLGMVVSDNGLWPILISLASGCLTIAPPWMIFISFQYRLLTYEVLFELSMKKKEVFIIIKAMSYHKVDL